MSPRRFREDDASSRPSALPRRSAGRSLYKNLIGYGPVTSDHANRTLPSRSGMPHHTHWHSYYKYRNMFGGPSRLVWFAFGSVATWAWIRHHEQHPRHHHGVWCHRRVDYGQPSDDERERRQISNMSRDWQRPVPVPMGEGTGTALGPQMRQTPVDPDAERLRQIGRNAEETVCLLLVLCPV
jgi:hypothetical protein